MIDDPKLQLTLKDRETSLIFSKMRSGLVARGRTDAALLSVPAEAESEEKRSALIDVVFSDYLESGSMEALRGNAETGDARQQSILAFGYRMPGRDLAEAAKWFRKAADQDYAPAQFNLGWMYDNIYLGMPGVGQDYVEAAEWYRKAADQGYAPAQFNLGVMYDTGEGVAQDHAEAARLYRKAADQGHALAQFNLGLKYDKGQGVAKDAAEAASWYRKAADQDLPSAQFNLGLKYINGLGVARDLLQAHMRINLAAAFASVDDQKRYATLRDGVAAKMSPGQTAEAQQMAADGLRRAQELTSRIQVNA